MAELREALEALDDPSRRHIVPVSGGKDSAALAIYLGTDLPADSEPSTCSATPTPSLPETYDYLDRLAALLGRADPPHQRARLPEA